MPKLAFADNPAAPKAPPIQLSAVWLKGQAGSGRELFVSIGEAAPLPLSVGGGGRGRMVNVVGPAGGIHLLGRPAGTTPPAAPSAPVAPGAAAGTTPPAPPPLLPLGDIAWPTGTPKKILLVLAASSGPGGKIQGVALADDDTAFPVHTVRVANFTSVSLLMRLNQTVKTVAPGASEPLPYAVVGDPKAKDVPSFPFALAVGDHVFFNGRIDSWPGSRTLVMIVPPTGAAKEPAIQIVVDKPAPPSGPGGKLHP